MNLAKLEKARRSKPFRPADIIVYAVAVLVTVLAVVFSYTAKGKTVEILINGNSFRYPLSENRELETGHLTVVVQDGKVWVKDSDCPDKVCEHTGKIGYENQTIACVPNKVIVRIVGDGLTVGTGQR